MPLERTWEEILFNLRVDHRDRVTAICPTAAQRTGTASPGFSVYGPELLLIGGTTLGKEGIGGPEQS